jgi:hemerythrin superfamily protein
MTLVLNDARQVFDDVGHRLRGRKDAMARAAGAAVRLAGRASWPRLAGMMALGFVAGVATLSARKVAMQATTGVAGDWFAALKADHRLVDGLFNVLLDTEDHETAKRGLLFAKIAYALAKHQFEEEHVIYPALRDGGPAETPKHLDAEHFEMKTYTHELSLMAKDDPRWIKKARVLHRLVQNHVREEEQIVFPALHDRLDKRENARLTRAMHREGIKLA